jgi:hypothetical protein
MINSNGKKNEYILTDPAITCAENPKRFSITNMAQKGIQEFFERHQCNNTCKLLKLRRNKYQKLADRTILETKIMK